MLRTRRRMKLLKYLFIPQWGYRCVPNSTVPETYNVYPGRRFKWLPEPIHWIWGDHFKH